MMSSYLLCLIAFLHLIICSQYQSIQPKKYYCVVTTVDVNHGCQGYDIVEQNTLTHYLNHSSKYFNSHEMYVFQGGNYTLIYPFKVRIQGVTSLTLRLTGINRTHSSRRAIIDCNGRASSFQFSHSSNVVLVNLVFTNCLIQESESQEESSKMLLFLNCTNISLLGITLLRSVEAFFIGDTTGNITIDNVVVANSNYNFSAGPALVNHSGNTIVFNHCYDDNTTSHLSITNSRFINNTNNAYKLNGLIGAGGLTIVIKCSNVKVRISNLTMVNNSGSTKYTGGHLAVITFPEYLYGSIKIANSTFEGGKAIRGAGIYILSLGNTNFNYSECWDPQHHQIDHDLLYLYNTTFKNNVAERYGGGVCIEQMESLNKCHRVSLVTFEEVTFVKNALKSVNNKSSGGIALHIMSLSVTDYIYHGNPQFKVMAINCSIYHNYIFKKPTIASSSIATAVLFVKSNHYFKIIDTAIFQNKATGIIGMSSNIILSKNVTISNNIGSSGGGIFLCQNAVIYLDAHTNVTIAHNRAKSIGGGISVETYYLESQPMCFFQLGHEPLTNDSLIETIAVTLSNNSAGYAGDNIFGGSIEYCFIIQSGRTRDKQNESSPLSTQIFYKIFHVPNNTIDYSSISSPPHRICLCQNKKLSCKHSLQYEVFPGETFVIEAVLVGQFNGIVPGTVEADLKHKISNLKKGEHVQKLSLKNCDKLTYTIYTESHYELLYLRVQHISDFSGFEKSFSFTNFTIYVQFKDCPLGFTLKKDNSSGHCDCSLLLEKYGRKVTCDITTATVTRVNPVWIGFVDNENGLKLLAIHKHCPFDYCLSTRVKLLSSNGSLSQDRQCAFNRSGVLCGSCSDGLSVILGSSECRKCSNYWIAILIPLALAGVVLLITLILCDITVADGTLSGIIFYCNIIGSNITTFFPSQSGKGIDLLKQVVKHLMLLVNLRQELSTCLFNGMDSYTKVWLDFAFPLYLWLLAGAFIFLAGGRCSWIVRRNAVKVLATFILLSYTRLLSSVAIALQVSALQLENGRFELRWLIDGNIKYFEGKHIPLAIIAIILSLFLFPLAFCLFLIQWLQRISHWKAFSWVNHLKPFFDVYTGPFTASGRFWTGLLLLSRGILLAVTAVNVNGSPSTILGAILLVVVALLTVTSLLPKGLYQQGHLNLLEYSSLINLGVLSSLLIIFYNSSRVSHNIISLTFTSIEILVLIGVIVYHFLKNKTVQKYCCHRKLKKINFGKIMGNNKIQIVDENEDDDRAVRSPDFPYLDEDCEPLLSTY